MLRHNGNTISIVWSLTLLATCVPLYVGNSQLGTVGLGIYDAVYHFGLKVNEFCFFQLNPRHYLENPFEGDLNKYKRKCHIAKVYNLFETFHVDSF